MEGSSAEGVPESRPVPPRAPEAGDCCQSGCERCVYDLYWDALTRYEARLEAWERARLAASQHDTGLSGP